MTPVLDISFAGIGGSGGGTPDDNSVTSAKIVNGAIVDADINAAAAIAKSKLAALNLVDADVSAISVSKITGAIGYTLMAAGASFSPADATTYFFGGLPSVVPTTSAAIERLYIPKAGKIKAAYIFFNQSTGSNETSSMSIRLNNTTDFLISNAVTNDSSGTAFNSTSLNSGNGIDVVAGDYVEIKWVTPTWGTNPTGVRPTVILYVE